MNTKLATAWITCGLALAILSGTARAQAPGQTPPGSAPSMVLETEEVTVTTRYGWQIAMVDAASLLAGAVSEEGGLTAAGYVFGGPIVHLAHGEGGRALGSAALRLTLPLLGVAIGAGTADCDGYDDEFLCGFGEAVVGGMIGMTTAVVIDYFVLAKTTKTELRSRRGLFEYRGVSATPGAAPTRDGVTVGLSGNF